MAPRSVKSCTYQWSALTLNVSPLLLYTWKHLLFRAFHYKCNSPLCFQDRISLSCFVLAIEIDFSFKFVSSRNKTKSSTRMHLQVSACLVLVSPLFFSTLKKALMLSINCCISSVQLQLKFLKCNQAPCQIVSLRTQEGSVGFQLLALVAELLAPHAE